MNLITTIPNFRIELIDSEFYIKYLLLLPLIQLLLRRFQSRVDWKTLKAGPLCNTHLYEREPSFQSFQIFEKSLTPKFSTNIADISMASKEYFYIFTSL